MDTSMLLKHSTALFLCLLCLVFTFNQTMTFESIQINPQFEKVMKYDAPEFEDTIHYKLTTPETMLLSHRKKSFSTQ